MPEIIITNVSLETEDVSERTEIQKNSSLLWSEKTEKESAVEKSQGWKLQNFQS